MFSIFRRLFASTTINCLIYAEKCKLKPLNCKSFKLNYVERDSKDFECHEPRKRSMISTLSTHWHITDTCVLNVFRSVCSHSVNTFDILLTLQTKFINKYISYPHFNLVEKKQPHSFHYHKLF